MSTIEWRLKRLADNSFEDQLFDVEVVDAFNRFGRQATAFIDDADGSRSDSYQRGSAVELEYSTDGGNTYTRRMGGFVVEPRERDDAGADVLELTVYSYDHFLRRDSVSRDLSGRAISAALETIIKNDTPVKWVGANVAVGNDVTLTREFRGEPIDNAIAELASKSANEEFGVNDDLEFFFQERDATPAPRGIDNTQWLDYDFPEQGQEAVNEVTVFFGEGGNEGSVTVRDGSDQEDLKQSIGTAGPVVLKEEVTRPEIDNASDARDVGEKVLNDRSSTLTGTVTTFGLFDAEPGDVIPVTIEPRDIDADFRIAKIEYQWGRDETVVTVVEREGAQDETLVRLTDTLDRVEQRAADRSVPSSIFEGPLASRETLTVNATVTTRSFGDGRFVLGRNRSRIGRNRSQIGLHIDDVTISNESTSRATNALRDAIRDGWSGASPPVLDTMAVGNGTAEPSRTDTALDSRQFNVTVSAQAGLTGEAVIEGTADAADAITLRELGVEPSGGDLHTRLNVTETTIEENTPVDYRVTISAGDDPDADGVVTDAGSNVTRDVIADANPDAPTQLAFGRNGSDPSTSDTALADEWQTEPIDAWTDRQTGVIDANASTTNTDGSAVTLQEWGLNGTDLKTHITIANLTLQDQDILNATQRLKWTND